MSDPIVTASMPDIYGDTNWYEKYLEYFANTYLAKAKAVNALFAPMFQTVTGRMPKTMQGTSLVRCALPSDTLEGAAYPTSDFIPGYSWSSTMNKWAINVNLSEESQDLEGADNPQKLLADAPGGFHLKLMKAASDLFQNATSAVAGSFKRACADTKALCANDHPYADPAVAGTQDNWLTGGSTALDETNGMAAIFAAAKAMRQFKDDRGEMMGIEPTHIVVPMGDREMWARRFVTQITPGTAASVNPVLEYNLGVIVLPELTNTSYWYLVSLPEMLNSGPFFKISPNMPKIKPYYKGSGVDGVDMSQYVHRVQRSWRWIIGNAGA